MKNSPKHIIILILLSLLGCNHNITYNPTLLYIDSLIQSRDDRPIQLLEDYDTRDLNTFNKSYYNILYTEAKDNEQLSLLDCDSLLNFAIKNLINSDNKDFLARAFFNKAKIWEELLEPEEATKSYQNALELLDNSENFHLLSRIYIDLGNLYLDHQLFDEALDYSKKGLFYSNTVGNTRNQFISLRNIGLTFLLKDQLDSAFVYFRKSVNYARETDNPMELINSISNDLAIYYHEKEKYDDALEYINRVTEMDEKYYLTKGDIFLELEQYDSARHYLSLSAQSDDNLVKVASFQNLYRLEELLGNYKEANEYLNNYMDGYDSIIVQTHTANVYAINQKHNIRRAIAQIERKHTARIIFLVILIVLLSMTSLLIFIIVNHKKKIEKKNQEQQLLIKEKQLLEKEFEISNLLKKIAQTKSTILRLSQKENNSASQRTRIQKENDLYELKNKVDTLRSKLIMDKPLYSKIMKLSKQKEVDDIKVLNPKEREELKKLIEFVYADFIEDLAITCPTLTEEDILFCCLSKLKLSSFAISICTGYSQTGSIRQRKHRIKKKMTEETDNSTLYESLFVS